MTYTFTYVIQLESFVKFCLLVWLSLDIICDDSIGKNTEKIYHMDDIFQASIILVFELHVA